MRKKLLITPGSIVLVLVLVALSFSACVPEEEVELPKYEWKIGTLVPEVTPMGAGMYEFAELVEERTNGQITMECFPVQQLGFWMDEFDNIMRGTQEMGFIPPSPRYEQFQAIFVDFAVTDWDGFGEAFGKGGPLWEYTDKGMDELGVKLLGFMNVGFEGYSGMKGPVVYPEDITKLKIKTRIGYPPSKLYYEQLGPVVSIDMAEVYTALQLGTIDCQANQAVETVYTQFHDVTKYFTDINSMAALCTIEINKELWDSLTPDLQRVLQETADEICTKVNNTCREKEEEYYRLFEEEGVVVTRITPEQRAKWIELARKPGGQWDQLRETLGDEVIDFLLEVTK